MSLARGCLALAGWLWSLSVCAAAGATIASVAKRPDGSAPAFEAGTRLLRASGADGAALDLADPFDAVLAEARWARLGPVVLDAADPRGQPVSRRLPPDTWGFDYRADGVDAAAAEALERFAQAGDARAYCELAAQPSSASDAPSRAWLLWRCSRLAAAARDWPRARAAFDGVVAALSARADARLAVILAYARLAQLAKQWPEYEHAAGLPLGGNESPALRLQLENLAGTVLVQRSHFAEAAAHLEALSARLPAAYRGTQLEAYIVSDLGFALRQLERFDDAERAYLRATAIHDAVAPVSYGAAGSHLNLGMLRRAQGRATEARSELEHAVAIARKLERTRLGPALNNLSLLYWDEGDFVAAEALQAEALAISEEIAPDGHDVAVSLQNLGVMALDRGDTRLAENRLRRAQAIFERVAPESNSLAIGHHHLARLDRERGDFEAATINYERAIALYSRLAPGTLREAWSHHNLGTNARHQGRFEDARRHLEAAQAIRAKVAPGGLDEARGFAALGALELERGERLAARGHLGLARQALTRLVPESEHLAVALHSLGELERGEGHATQALETFCEADRVLDLQRRRISASREMQSEYAAQHARIPTDCAWARLAAGEPGPALDVVERSRARGLRDRLGDFRVAFASLPAPLRAARSDLSARRVRLEAVLADAGSQPAQRETAGTLLAQLARDEQAWRERLEKEAPRIARSLEPRVDDHRALLARLPRDTAVLTWLAGPGKTQAWLLSGASRTLHSAEIAIDAAELARLSGSLRRAILQRRPHAALRRDLQQAHARLVGPLAGELAPIKRLLVVPDQGMTLLPFAALVDAQGRHLVETFDLAIAPAISVALVDEERPASPQSSLVAVAVTGARSVDLQAGRIDFEPIPAAAGEVAAIAGDYGDAARLFVDTQATEEGVRDAARASSILHIASHGFFDPQRPLDSGIVLARASPRDDGVLHAWEVMANWNLEASRLVVLSACDTGIGEERAGEGLIGLGRAFQYAGARGVVASLWPVADASTARLMRGFHGALLQGRRPAAALREAQLALLRAGRAADSTRRGVGGVRPSERETLDSHPFHWAGFEVFGQLP